MEWTQFIISALSGILGAAVGGFATYKTATEQFKFMAEQELQKQRRDDELYLKRKREEVYLKLLDLLNEYIALHNDNKAPNDVEMKEFWKKYQQLRPAVKVYASQHIEEWFSESLDEVFYGAINGQVNNLAKEIRKELGIKD